MKNIELTKHTDKALINNAVWVCIPVYNNADTIFAVAERVLKFTSNVVVVNDGSNDCDLEKILTPLNIKILSHKKNMGKGKAIMSGARFVEKQGGIYMVTMDADGQHNPEDMPKLVNLIDGNENAVVIGSRDFSGKNIPSSSRFGRKFSDFWVHLETGIHVNDTQSGFRVYPVKLLNSLKASSTHYDFEIEILVKLIWKRVKVSNVLISVFYPEKEKRVSHFKPFLDNLRISLTHMKLVCRRLLPIFEKNSFKDMINEDLKVLNYWKHPVKLLKMLLSENLTPLGISTSAAMGIFIGTLPILGLHIVSIIYICSRLHINKMVALSIQNFCAPPFIPALAILIGYYLRTGELMNSLSLEMIFDTNRIYEWIVGSIILAPIAAIITFILVYMISVTMQKLMKKNIVFNQKKIID
ncbi:MAG: hypothetical protein ACD_79C00729G0002 [uncultured bacterium]|nr:MAG: hypothetical protein ACD_79C00729G0002 [uncultured bacterium]